MMMLSPVHIMSQTTAFRLGYDRADSIADVPQTIAARAAALSTPIAIVHGMQDELSPSYHSSLFMSAVPGSVPKRYVAVEDEGHVFSSFESWQRVVDTFLEFARAHLSPTGLAEAGLTRGSNLGVPAETA
jgi:esterase/lipase